MGRRVSAQRLSNWYYQLGQSTAAGLGLAESLRQSAGPPARDREAMADRLDQGEATDAILENAPGWLPRADRYLLSAAAQSGRLPQTCSQLATHHRTLSDQRRHVISASIYPVAVLHFAIFVLPLPSAVAFSESGSFSLDFVVYTRILGAGLILFWGTFWGLSLLSRRAPRILRRVQRYLPGIRRYAHARGLARFAWGLEALLTAGVSMRDAFGGAALICDDSVLTPRLLAILPEIDRGRPPGPALGQVKGIPAEFSALYQTGERTGQLDVTLERLSQKYEEEAKAGLRSAAFWYPKLLFFLISLLIGAAITQVFGQYLEFVESLAL